MSTHKALTSPGEGKDAVVSTIPIPKIADDEILVKNAAVALNPTDWKHMRFVSPKGAAMGCDFSGTVKDVGPSVKNVKVGDRVAGFVQGSYFGSGDIGAFAEHTKAKGDCVWKVSENASPEEAAAIGGIAGETASFALYYTLDLPLPDKTVNQSDETVLVWSGATSVGQYAIQMAKASGYKVVTTASPENHEYLKGLGADATFNYKDSDVASQIKNYAKITRALDCISEKGTTKLAADSMTGGTVVTLLPVSAEKEGIEHVKVANILVYCTGGYAFTFFGRDFPAKPEDKEARVTFLRDYMPKLVADGKLKANPLTKITGGLEGIVEKMKYMEAGKAKREKFVYSFGQ